MKPKELLSYITCCASFVIGWLLTIAGFIIPPTGVVSDSVLWILGQSLLYCGAVLGISNFYSSQLTKFKNEVRKELKS